MRKILFAAIAALSLGWGAHAIYTSAETPASVQAPATLPHVTTLEGGSNFRDLGGYATDDGHRVRTGLVFRSGGTDNFTAADVKLVHKLGIRRFCDLRDARERHPVRPQGVDFPPVQTWPDQPALAAFDVSNAEAARKTMLTGYAAMPEAYAQQIGDIFRHIARGDMPIAFNCSAGKDRTGVTAAILLRMLGVPMDTVMRDYLASNHYFDAEKLTHGQPVNELTGLSKVDPAALRVLERVEPEWLNASFATIEADYGSLDGYLHKGLGLTDAEIASIRQHLLEVSAGH